MNSTSSNNKNKITKKQSSSTTKNLNTRQTNEDQEIDVTKGVTTLEQGTSTSDLFDGGKTKFPQNLNVIDIGINTSQMITENIVKSSLKVVENIEETVQSEYEIQFDSSTECSSVPSMKNFLYDNIDNALCWNQVQNKRIEIEDADPVPSTSKGKTTTGLYETNYYFTWDTVPGTNNRKSAPCILKESTSFNEEPIPSTSKGYTNNQQLNYTPLKDYMNTYPTLGVTKKGKYCNLVQKKISKQPIKVTSEQSTSEELTSEPSTSKPSTSRQSTFKPSTSRQSTSKPSTSKQSTFKQSMPEPSTSKQSTPEPSTSRQPTSKPSISRQPISKSSTSEPSTTKKSASKQSTSEQSTSGPSTSRQSTFKSKPSTSKQSTSDPSTSRQLTTEQSTYTSSTKQDFSEQSDHIIYDRNSQTSNENFKGCSIDDFSTGDRTDAANAGRITPTTHIRRTIRAERNDSNAHIAYWYIFCPYCHKSYTLENAHTHDAICPNRRE